MSRVGLNSWWANLICDTDPLPSIDGGLVGQNDGTITNAYATGAVTGSGGPIVGGLVGDNSGTISDAYATGTATGGRGGPDGGLAGLNYGAISEAYATGAVVGSGVNGGLVGGNYGTISDVYASGAISGGLESGGLIGFYEAGTITNGYWNEDRSGTTIGVGTGSSAGVTGLSVSGSSPFTASSYTGFSFTTTPGAQGNAWVIVDVDGTLNNAGSAVGGTMPMLASEYATSIVNAHQLQLMAMAPGASYTLAAHVDASATASSTSASTGTDVWGSAGFIPVGGNGGASFTGIFNGQGYVVTTLTTNTGYSDVGLFGAIGASGVVENIGLVGGSISGGGSVGGLAGTNSGTIKNAYNTGTVSGGDSDSLVGGLVGYGNAGSISNAYATGAVSSGFGSFVGGLVGMSAGDEFVGVYATGAVTQTGTSGDYGPIGGGSVGGLIGNNIRSTITGAYATGVVTGFGSSGQVGGLVGISSGEITDAHATGAVNGGPGSDVGGLVGFNYSPVSIATISGAYATGAVGGNNSNAVGGLVGNNGGLLINVSATGAVSGGGSSAVGGLVGSSGGAITYAYATGAVNGGNGNAIGGLVGNNSAVITDAYSTGTVGGGSDSYIGGLVGYNNFGTINDAYATGAVIGGNGSTVGGLVGLNVFIITDSYATGAVSSGGGSSIGGLIGSNNGNNTTIANGNWNEDRSGTAIGVGSGSSAGVTGLSGSGSSPFTASSYAGFSFTTTPGAQGNAWVIVDLDGTLNNAGGAAGGTMPMFASEYATSIVNAHQLQLMAMAPGASYTLAANIDASATASSTFASTGIDVWGSAGFIPVGGNGAVNFTGTFNGQGYAVSGLTINSRDANVGLFGVVGAGSIVEHVGLDGGSFSGSEQVGELAGSNDGTIRNAYTSGTVDDDNGGNSLGGLVGLNFVGTISDAYATGVVIGGLGSSVGGLVGQSDGTIEHAYATGTVYGDGLSVGGLVGTNGGTISEAYATGSVNGSNFYTSSGGLVGNNTGAIEHAHATGAVNGGFGYYSQVGGLVGSNSGGTVSDSYASGAVSGGEFAYAGGLVGVNEDGTISDAYATGAVAGGGASATGGLAGQNYDGIISDVYATGSVTGGLGSYAGGLVGDNVGSGTITHAYATGVINGGGFVGGLVGANYPYSTITDAYATGAVGGSGGIYGYVGGLIGTNGGTISGTYATGTVSSGNTSYNGGLAGSNNGTITHAYATGTVSGSGYVGGLIGINYGTISNAYAIGAVSGRGSVGGLAGSNGGTISETYWDTTTSGTTIGAGTGPFLGVTGLTTQAWLTQGPIATGVFDTTSIWVAGYPYPVLKALPYVLITAAGTQTYGATNPSFTITTIADQNGNDATSLVNSSGVSWLTAASATSNIGPYVIGGTGATVSAGYQLTYIGTLSVTPATLTAGLAGIVSKTYDGTVAATLATGNYTLSGVLNNDSVSLNDPVSGSYASPNVGSDITVTVSGLALRGTAVGNYVLATDTASGDVGSITPATLTYIANSSTRTYRAANPAFTGTVTGFVNGETLTTSTTGMLAFATPATIASNAGAYAIDGGGLTADNGNYLFVQAAGNATALTINPAALSAGLTGTIVKFFDGTTAATFTPDDYTLSGVLNNDSVRLNDPTTGSYATPTPGGNIPVTVGGLSLLGAAAGNYTLTSTTLTANIGIIIPPVPQRLLPVLTALPQPVPPDGDNAWLLLVGNAFGPLPAIIDPNDAAQVTILPDHIDISTGLPLVADPEQTLVETWEGRHLILRLPPPALPAHLDGAF